MGLSSKDFLKKFLDKLLNPNKTAESFKNLSKFYKKYAPPKSSESSMNSYLAMMHERKEKARIYDLRGDL